MRKGIFHRKRLPDRSESPGRPYILLRKGRQMAKKKDPQSLKRDIERLKLEIELEELKRKKEKVKK